VAAADPGVGGDFAGAGVGGGHDGRTVRPCCMLGKGRRVVKDERCVTRDGCNGE
jgi:hypothetical protein